MMGIRVVTRKVVCYLLSDSLGTTYASIEEADVAEEEDEDEKYKNY